MATYGIGSSGSDVRKLQEALNKNGYNLATDGVYGSKTQAAVRDYQQKNGLKVDGIAGNETLGSLYGTTTQQTTQNTTHQYTAPNTSQQGYMPSYTPANPKDYAYDPNTNEAYLKALAALEKANGSTPTYTPSYDKQLEELYDKIVNREDFTYDLNADAIYDQYRSQYMRLGAQAMQDTMGQAAALTGGYGSSYGQNVGQQAYNEYLARLNDIVPELHEQAYGRYQDEGQEMLNQYAMLGDMAEDEYNKYMDAYNQWLAQLQMSREDVDTAYNRGYTDFINAMQMAYQKDRDAVADSQWAQEMAFQQAQFAYKQQQDAMAYARAQASSSSAASSSGGSTQTGGGGTDVSGYDPDDLYYMGNNIYSKSKGMLVGFVDENAAAMASISEVRKDLNAVKKDASRTELRTMIMQSGLTTAEKTKLIKEYCG